MDYKKLQAKAGDIIKKYGVDIEIVVGTPATYDPILDTYDSTLATYSAFGVMVNPTMQSESGLFSKSDSVRWLVSVTGAPASLDKIDFKIVYNSEEWMPAKIVPIKPGGTALVYLIDAK